MNRGDLVFIKSLTGPDLFGVITHIDYKTSDVKVRLADGGRRDILQTKMDKAVVLRGEPALAGARPLRLNYSWLKVQREMRLPSPEKLARVKKRAAIPKVARAFRDMCQHESRLDRWTMI